MSIISVTVVTFLVLVAINILLVCLKPPLFTATMLSPVVMTYWFTRVLSRYMMFIRHV